MPELVGIVDTGVLCCWLEVPGKSSAGSGDNKWDNDRANREIDSIIKRSGTLILPISVIIETANHIAQSGNYRKIKADLLVDKIVASLEGTRPWRQFSEPERIWNIDWFRTEGREWGSYAERKIGMADYSIYYIAKFFSELGSDVVALTTDTNLEIAVQSIEPPATQRRRRR